MGKLGYSLTTFEMSLDQLLELTDDDMLPTGKACDATSVKFELDKTKLPGNMHEEADKEKEIETLEKEEVKASHTDLLGEEAKEKEEREASETGLLGDASEKDPGMTGEISIASAIDEKNDT